MGFIVTAFLLLAAVATFALGTFADVGPAGLISLIYVVVAAVYVFASLHLWRYRSAIKLMQQGYGVHALADALRHQKSFWKLIGIISVIFVGLYGVAFLFGIAVGVMK
jgi:hypothetical protein